MMVVMPMLYLSSIFNFQSANPIQGWHTLRNSVGSYVWYSSFNLLYPFDILYWTHQPMYYFFFLIYKRTEIWECFWKWGMEWLSMYLYILSDGCFELQWERIKEKQKLGVVRKGSCFMISHHKTTRYLTSYFFFMYWFVYILSTL